MVVYGVNSPVKYILYLPFQHDSALPINSVTADAAQG
jgi:hypothetical protein